MEIAEYHNAAQQVHRIDVQNGFYYLAFLESNQNQEQQWPFQRNYFCTFLQIEQLERRGGGSWGGGLALWKVDANTFVVCTQYIQHIKFSPFMCHDKSSCLSRIACFINTTFLIIKQHNSRGKSEDKSLQTIHSFAQTLPPKSPWRCGGRIRVLKWGVS